MVPTPQDQHGQLNSVLVKFTYPNLFISDSSLKGPPPHTHLFIVLNDMQALGQLRICLGAIGL